MSSRPKIPYHEVVEGAEVQRRLEALHQCKTDLASKVFEIGEHLAAVKKMVGHGRFMEVVGEVGWSERSCNYFMAIYRDFESAPRATLRQFDPTAARYLTGPDMAEERGKALSAAAAGKRITTAEAKKARDRIKAAKRSAAKTADKYAPRPILSPEKIKTAIAALEKNGREPTVENIAQRLRVAVSAVREEMEKIAESEKPRKCGMEPGTVITRGSERVCVIPPSPPSQVSSIEDAAAIRSLREQNERLERDNALLTARIRELEAELAAEREANQRLRTDDR
jgi:hypothetical protein